MPVTLSCLGQPIDRYARPVGERCGATWSGVSFDHAGVLGWRVGPAVPEGARRALCPRCVRGDPTNDQAAEPSPSGALATQLTLFPATEGPAS